MQLALEVCSCPVSDCELGLARKWELRTGRGREGRVVLLGGLYVGLPTHAGSHRAVTWTSLVEGHHIWAEWGTLLPWGA